MPELRSPSPRFAYKADRLKPLRAFCHPPQPRHWLKPSRRRMRVFVLPAVRSWCKIFFPWFRATARGLKLGPAGYFATLD